MNAALNPTPRPILTGILDDSPGVLTPVLQSLPTHLPHFFIFAEEGSTEPQLVVGDSRLMAYGAKTFDAKYQYLNHQTVLSNYVNSQGNQAMYQRLKPTDANDPATIRVSLDVLEMEVPEYERDALGFIVRNADTQEPVPTGDMVPGVRIKIVVGEATGGLANASTTTGSMVDPANPDNQSMVYPWFDADVSSFGDHGNHKGFRIWAPTMRSLTPTNEELILNQQAFLYRFQMIKREDAKSQPNVVKSIRGSNYVEFMLKPGAVNERVSQALHIDDAVMPAYTDKATNPVTRVNFKQIYVYQEFVDMLLEKLYDIEKPFHPDWTGSADDSKYMVNLVGGQHYDGTEYTAIQMVGPAEGGVRFTQNSNHYARGGSDGTMNHETFNELVREQCLNYGELDFPFLDSAKYPHSMFWDSGFSIETKKALMHPVGKRKDVGAIICTQDIAAPQNTPEQEASVLTALRSYGLNFIESEVHGTPLCRIAIFGQSGKLVNSTYRGILPLTVDLAKLVAAYMGAGSGRWDPAEAFDASPKNIVTLFEDINQTYRPAGVAAKDWSQGLNYVQSFDRNRYFWAAFQTVYDNKSSPLNSLINMFTYIEMEKVCERNWRRMSGGNAKLTPEQFIERSNADILRDIGDRFDGRYIFVPRTYFTDLDTELGYSYSCDIEVYSNPQYLVGTYTIVARRRAQLLG